MARISVNVQVVSSFAELLVSVPTSLSVSVAFNAIGVFIVILLNNAHVGYSFFVGMPYAETIAGPRLIPIDFAALVDDVLILEPVGAIRAFTVKTIHHM